MPAWMLAILDMAIKSLLNKLEEGWAQQGLCMILREIDTLFQQADARVTNPQLKVVVDEIAATFHDSVEKICKALGQ